MHDATYKLPIDPPDRVWRLEWKQIGKGHKYDGKCYPSRRIAIDPRVITDGQQATVETIVHEVLHAMAPWADENWVTAAAAKLAEVLIDQDVLKDNWGD